MIEAAASFRRRALLGARSPASRPRWVLLLCLALGSAIAASLPSRAAAQQGTTALIGSVTDAESGAPVVDAVVTVTSPNLQGEELAVTDETGSYLLPGLPPGVYALRIESDRHRPYARTGLDLHADTTIRLNASLLPESLQAEEVVVVGRTPTVDVGSSATGVNITSEFTARVPLIAPGAKGAQARSFEAAAEVAPGARADAFGVSLFGSSSPENRYLLDGLSVNNPTFGLIGTPLSIEFIKEVSVLSGGYMPEYGRATGGILNAITKSGTNEFHGSAFSSWSPGSIAGRRRRVVREGGTIVTEPSLDHQVDVGAEVGGPIVRDELWFYLGFDWSRSTYDLRRTLHRTLLDDSGSPLRDASGNVRTEYIPGTRRSYLAQQDVLQGIGKLTWAVNPKNRVNLTLIGVYPRSGGDGKFGVDPQTGQPEIGTNVIGTSNGLNGSYQALAHRYKSSSTNAQLKWSSELDKDRVFLDTWVGWHYEQMGRLASDGSPVGSQSGLGGVSNVWWLRTDQPHSLAEFEEVPGGACDAPGACPVTDYRTGGPEYVEQQDTHRLQERMVLTTLFQALGHHVFKVGLDFEQQLQRGVRGYTGARDFAEAADGSYVQLQSYGYLVGPDQPVILTSLANDTRSISMGAFVQDSWSIADRVTLNLGLRYDTQLLYAREGNLAMALPNQWSPRAGIVYDPTREGHAKLYANYARYFETVPLRILDRYLSGEPLLLAGADPARCNPADPTQQLGSCLAADSLQPFGSTPDSKYLQLSAGTSVVDPDIKPPSTDEVVLGGDYEIVRDGRLGVTYTKRWLNNTIEDMSRDEGQTFFFGNPGRGLGSDFPKAERKYDGITLYFTKQFSEGWLAQASYTLSWLRGNYGGLFRAEDLQFDPHQNTDFDLGSLNTNRKGPLPGDHRHFFKLFGAREIALGGAGFLTPGLAFRAFSGDPSNVLGAHPTYLLDQIYILPRGAGERLPWNCSLDLRLAYGFEVAKGRGLALTVDAFNVFNWQRATARDQRYTATPVNPVASGGLSSVTDVAGSPLDPGAINPNFGRATVYQPPRVFRFGLKGTF